MMGLLVSWIVMIVKGVRLAALPAGVYGIWMSLKDAGVTTAASTIEHCIAIGLCVYVAAWPLRKNKEN